MVLHLLKILEESIFPSQFISPGYIVLLCAFMRLYILWIIKTSLNTSLKKSGSNFYLPVLPSWGTGFLLLPCSSIRWSCVPYSIAAYFVLLSLSGGAGGGGGGRKSSWFYTLMEKEIVILVSPTKDQKLFSNALQPKKKKKEKRKEIACTAVQYL